MNSVNALKVFSDNRGGKREWYWIDDEGARHKGYSSRHLALKAAREHRVSHSFGKAVKGMRAKYEKTIAMQGCYTGEEGLKK